MKAPRNPDSSIKDWTPPPAACPACGKPGPHFAPPSCGEAGFFICQSTGDINECTVADYEMHTGRKFRLDL